MLAISAKVFSPHVYGDASTFWQSFEQYRAIISKVFDYSTTCRIERSSSSQVRLS